MALAPKPDNGWVLAMDRTNWQFGRTHINILGVSVILNGVGLPIISHDFQGAEALEIYRMRWGIATLFSHLKRRGNESGKIPVSEADSDNCAQRCGLTRKKRRERLVPVETIWLVLVPEEPGMNESIRRQSVKSVDDSMK